MKFGCNWFCGSGGDDDMTKLWKMVLNLNQSIKKDEPPQSVMMKAINLGVQTPSWPFILTDD